MLGPSSMSVSLSLSLLSHLPMITFDRQHEVPSRDCCLGWTREGIETFSRFSHSFAFNVCSSGGFDYPCTGTNSRSLFGPIVVNQSLQAIVGLTLWRLVARWTVTCAAQLLQSVSPAQLDARKSRATRGSTGNSCEVSEDSEDPCLSTESNTMRFVKLQCDAFGASSSALRCAMTSFWVQTQLWSSRWVASESLGLKVLHPRTQLAPSPPWPPTAPLPQLPPE